VLVENAQLQQIVGHVFVVVKVEARTELALQTTEVRFLRIHTYRYWHKMHFHIPFHISHSENCQNW